jgi:hypothetical protein
MPVVVLWRPLGSNDLKRKENVANAPGDSPPIHKMVGSTLSLLVGLSSLTGFALETLMNDELTATRMALKVLSRSSPLGSTSTALPRLLFGTNYLHQNQ